MNFDYIIIGAGVIGSSTAYYLKSALPDSKILLIDRAHSAGAGNTARSAALYRNFFSSSTNRMLAGSSIRYYLELGNKVQLDPIGYLWLFSKEQWAGLQPRDCRGMRRQFLQMEPGLKYQGFHCAIERLRRKN